VLATMNDKEKNTQITELEIEKKSLEIDKLKQEHEKLGLEIKELSKSNFKKTNWWGILIPLSFSIIPIVYLLLSGIFDSKYQEYKASKASLEYDQKKFTDIREAMNSEVKKIQDSLLGLEKLVYLQKDSVDFLSRNISQSKQNVLSLETDKNRLSNDLKQKDSVLEDAITSKQKIKKNLEDSIGKLVININNLQNANLLLNNNIGLANIYREKANNTKNGTIEALETKLGILELQLKQKDTKIKNLEEVIKKIKE
jgi:hypothetical protein